MSGAFLSTVSNHLPEAQITVDWFHIVQQFTQAVDDVRKQEGRIQRMPSRLRWAMLKRGDLDHLATHQLMAIAELLEQGLDTATAWRVKERLRWVRRWTSTYTNARLEGLNGLFQAARARTRDYRKTQTFITMIYLIASPAGRIFKST